MDTEEGVPAQYFYVPILEAEGAMGGYGRGISGKLVIGGLCNGEVGQTGYANR